MAKKRDNICLVPFEVEAGREVDLSCLDDIRRMRKFSIPGFEGDNLFAFSVKGSSMEPIIRAGSLVICEKTSIFNPLIDNQIYVIMSKRGLVLKYVLRKFNKSGMLVKLKLKSENLAYPPFEIDINEGEDYHLFRYRGQVNNFGCSKI